MPIGLLTNRRELRLVYAPHGESSGHISFRVDDMATVGGRPILDAFLMLLSATRFFGVAEAYALPALLAESRKRQANVTTELAEQVFEALAILLRGFESAAERDGDRLLDDALKRDGDHLYKGLLTVLLRLVFILFAEDRGLLPTENRFYAENLSLLALYDRLREDAGAYPDSMSRRFGAWGQLLSLFRAIYLGAKHGELSLPARQGTLFDPHAYAFLEGWGPAGGAPISLAEHRAAVKVPTVDDETVFRVLDKLIVFEGQRLSYRALDVEQIGSVYEALMGYHVIRVPSPAVCMRPEGIWLTVEEVLGVAPAQRAKWLKETIGLTAAQAERLASALRSAKGPDAALEELGELAKGGTRSDRALARARAGQLVLQPGAERRRTSSHYTPRSLSAPIVEKTLAPLLACMGTEPASDRILDLKICDPAMGSGAFLVEACRYLADQVVAAWTREKEADGGITRLAAIAAKHGDPLRYARRLVAQRCLYGVDKNDAAVELAKLSLWLVTLARDLPFTFLDHALRHGDSLVGLDFEQIRHFHWKPQQQLTLASKVLDEALGEAIAIREKILDLADDGSEAGHREKKGLLDDARDACDRARLLGDLVVGAFFAGETDRERERERLRRLDMAERWIAGDGSVEAELRQLQAEVRERVPVFHWMLEYPEIFHAEREDPLDDGRANRVAMMDAFMGNPPFLSGKRISTVTSPAYANWLSAEHDTGRNVDLSGHFFRKTFRLLGASGTLGLIATKTISEGENRRGSLQSLIADGARIYAAETSFPWPGEAAVFVSVIHVAAGKPKQLAGSTLNGEPATSINSALESRTERPDPRPLPSNAELCFTGCFIRGEGFYLEPSEADRLLRIEQAVTRRIIGGDELNNSHRPMGRSIVDFGERSLEDASRYSEAMKLVRSRVKEERLSLPDNPSNLSHKRKWWLFANARGGTRSPGSRPRGHT
ncbi:MAG: N-6 DNA methylase [Myxococcales bacterium]|nr:N-6 DNA methylase [Myxococcales bacterium]